MQPIRVDGRRLTVDDILSVAVEQRNVELADEARSRAAQSHEFAERISTERAVYGRTTGVGANRDVAIDNPAAHAVALARSHATSAGPLRVPERVRAMLVVRLNQLAAGGSGASPALLDGLVRMINADALPEVREFGSIGTGDLSALATTALALTGETPTSPITLGPHDALAFLSSNAAAVGDAALACTRLTTLARATVSAGALTFTAVDGNPEAFAEVVEQATPFEGARQVCRWVRSLVEPDGRPARIQDPFGLRAMPQVHGALLDALTHAEDVVTRMANAPSENPLLLPDGGVAHHAGFHAAYLGQALDAVVSAAAQSAQLVLARLSMLCEPAFTGLPPFLGDGRAGASGVMSCEYVAASALGSLRALTAPTGVQTVTLSRGVEEDASFASLAARQALDAVDRYRIVLACEVVAAVRATRMRGLPVPAPLASLPSETADRDLSADLDQAVELLDRWSTSLTAQR